MNAALMPRRTFLKRAGFGIPALLAGCAAGSSGGDKPIGRVVVIGGGFGGATAARYIAMWSARRIEVVLVEPAPRFVSCPLSNLVLGGSRTIEQLTQGYGPLADGGVQVVHDEAIAIDAGKRQVHLARGPTLTYERLVVAPGVDLLYEDIPGLGDEAARQRVPSAWRAGPQTVALRRQLEAMPDGGVFVMTIPRSPYRCPPGPYERACQVASYFRAAKPRSKVVILDANADIVSKKALFLAAWNDLYPGIIDYLPSQDTRDVDVPALTVKTEFDSFKGDVLNVIPPMRAGRLAVQAGLATSGGRWCEVDWQTTEAVATADIHVLGDATLSAEAMPKSASMANNHAKIAASAIVARMTGEPINPMPSINNTCYSYVSDREAIHVDSVHRWDPGRKTLLPVPGSGGVSERRSELEKAYADAWAQNIWADTLG